MGVPYLFNYICERYPCVNEIVHEYCIPSFDNFYVDMNGLIYNFVHDDEAKLFKDMCTHIDRLCCLIKPQRLFFLAVDGVAPRPKLNQMRLGRLQAAAAVQATNQGEENTFKRNCITPGTEFMGRLHDALRVFVKNKISTDPLWQRCRVILSGHDSPGEGEHKIMDYIRYLKSQKGYDPRTRHCVYGPDADLIILGLCSHELHFVTFRNQIKYGIRSAMEAPQFLFLDLGLLREYLQLEFSALRQYKSFSMSKLIDDWVFMSLLFGNDFIPCATYLDMSSNDLALVHQTYMKVYPKLGGNINENGTLNLSRLEILMEALSEVEFEMFQEFGPLSVVTDVDEDLPVFGDNVTEKDFELYKRYFYTKAFNCEEIAPQRVAEFANNYVEGLQWILFYYYKGVPDWNWYYPHHYPPFISDLKNLKDVQFEFNIGKPLLHFEHLLAVTPAASISIIPTAYHDLLISPTSEVVHFYPNVSEVDVNKLIRLPFIDMELLHNAMKKCEADLTPDELNRDRHGPMLQYDYTSQSEGEQQLCTENAVWNDQIAIPSELCPLVELQIPNRNAHVPGFPTIKHLSFNFQLKNAGIRVHFYPSEFESMILEPILSENNNDIAYVKRKCLDRIVHIGWPYMIKAKVVAISNRKVCITGKGIKANNSRMFDLEMRTIRERLFSRLGIDIGECQVLVHVKTLIGMPLEYESQGKLSTYDVWSEGTISHPASIVICDLNVHERYIEPYKPSFGSEGTVLNPEFKIDSERLKVCITVHQNPDLSAAKRLPNDLYSSYLSAYQIGSLLELRSECIWKLTSVIFIIPGERRPVSQDETKFNIGLAMRFYKRNEELFEYTHKKDTTWLFSPNAVATIIAYKDKFPEVYDYISQMSTCENCFESDIFPDKVGEDHLEEIVKWIAEQDFSKAERVPFGAKCVEKKVFEKIIDSIEQIQTLPLRTVELQVHRECPFRLFDRVVVVRNTYLVPIGSTGTIIGIIPASDTNSIRWEHVKRISNWLNIYFDKGLQCDNSIYGLGVGRVMRVREIAVLAIPN